MRLSGIQKQGRNILRRNVQSGDGDSENAGFCRFCGLNRTLLNGETAGFGDVGVDVGVEVGVEVGVDVGVDVGTRAELVPPDLDTSTRVVSD